MATIIEVLTIKFGLFFVICFNLMAAIGKKRPETIACSDAITAADII